MTGQDVVLGMLVHSPKTGYQIKQMITRIFSFFFDASYGTVYPTLRKLEREGMIQKEVVLQEGKPNKNVYAITPAGISTFQLYLERELAEDILKSDILVRLYFGDLADRDTVCTWIDLAAERAEARERQLRKDLREYSGMSKTQQICLRYGISKYAHDVNFFKQALSELRDAATTEKKG
ncbi:PadR family transcriptional regulator [Paenibacillus sp. IB182496]|uniref:PadR family transcriptional regulator n=1 Tax=Paenibacillus sabuli TaxID=2772509 RepID=A0A927BWL3_9BACL|nr:PadR family transcriptional regulator [Paenibacillus sabuli]MBD2847236.1 PadR family transcriptional regulator [Paenibacillus sabuli]